MSVRDWQIERHLLGELPPSEAEALVRALATDEGVVERTREILDSNRQILEAHPARVAAAAIRERLGKAAPAVGWKAVAAGIGWRRGVLALAASVVVVAAGSLLLRGPEPPVAENRIKGLRPSILVYRHTPAGDEALADGTAVRPGDLVQVAYQAAGRPFGVIVSLDGRGSVTVHHPKDGRAAARLVSGQPVRLTHAYRLDDAPRWERFYFVTSDHPFEVDVVVSACRLLAADRTAPVDKLPLPASLDQFSFTLTKEEP